MPKRVAELSQEDQARMFAAIDMVRRSGATEIQIRWSDDEQPHIWMAVAKFRVNRDGVPAPHGAGEGAEAAGALDPISALERLLEVLVDGGVCKHCERPSGVEHDWRARLPMADLICWYSYDPELKKYRRSCEGEADWRERAAPALSIPSPLPICPTCGEQAEEARVAAVGDQGTPMGPIRSSPHPAGPEFRCPNDHWFRP